MKKERFDIIREIRRFFSIQAFEKIIPEYGGADQDALSSIGNYMKKNMKEFLKECDKKTPEQLVEERYKRFRKF